jgi:trimeric autotransporter adhesin
MRFTPGFKFCSAAALIILMVFQKHSWAQLNGSYNIPGNYLTLQDAINDLNVQGVSGTVILNVIAGNPQAAVQGGYLIGGTGSSILSGAYSTSFSKRVYITGNGNTVTAFSPQATGSLTDAIFKIIGADFVSIENFIIQENLSNTITAAASNNMTEWGIAFLYFTVNDGAKDNTIEDNIISLNRTYQNSFGIYSNVNHSPANATTPIPMSSLSGSNSNLHIYGNQISNVNTGIAIIGSVMPYSDIGLIIGNSSSNGNTITDFGYTGTFSSFAYVPHDICGIVLTNQLSCNISYNSITSSAGSTISGTLRGIYSHFTGGLSPGNNYININSNSIALHSGNALGDIIGIGNETGNDNTSLTLNNNDIHQLVYSTAGSGYVNAIANTADTYEQQFVNNIFSNLYINTSGAVNLMALTGVPSKSFGSKLVRNNSIVGSLDKPVGGGSLYCINELQATLLVPNTSTTIDSNNFSDISLTGFTSFVGLSCGQTYSSTLSANLILKNNVVQNVSGGAYGINGIISRGYKIENNIIRNFSAQGGLTGIYCRSKDEVTRNTVGDFICSADNGVFGISCSEPDGMKLTRNKIYSLTNTDVDGFVIGIYINSSITTAEIFVNNNLVGDLHAPHSTSNDAIRGIELGNSWGSSALSAWIYYNTIWVNAVSTSSSIFGVNLIHSFGGILGPPDIKVYNNILVNTSVPGPIGGFNTAIKFWTYVPGYYHGDNNCYFTGNPAPNQLVFGDGFSYTPTHSLETVSDFSSFLSNGSEYYSIMENPPFLSTSGISQQFLHIDSTLATGIESGGKHLIGYNIDFDNEKRWGAAGYTGFGHAPDIGADEIWNLPLTIKYNLSASDIIISPKPAIDQFTITSGKKSGTMEISITDAKGREVFSLPKTVSKQLIIDTRDFAAGVYFIRILSEDKVQTEKIVIAKR